MCHYNHTLCTTPSSYLAIFGQYAMVALSWSFSQSMALQITSTVSKFCHPRFLLDSLEHGLQSLNLQVVCLSCPRATYVHSCAKHSGELHIQSIFRLNFLTSVWHIRLDINKCFCMDPHHAIFFEDVRQLVVMREMLVQ